MLTLSLASLDFLADVVHLEEEELHLLAVLVLAEVARFHRLTVLKFSKIFEIKVEVDSD